MLACTTVYAGVSSVAFERFFDGAHGNIFWRKTKDFGNLSKLGLMDCDCSVP